MSSTQQVFDVVVADHRRLVGDVYRLELASLDGRALPAVSPGAHLDIHLPDGLVRQYSLLDDAGAGSYRIGVQRERDSRGGSAYLAERVCPGTPLKISTPRNHFTLDEAAKHSLLIAGGIGITPLLAMARRLALRNASFELHYLVRHREQAAFVDELVTLLPPGALHLHVSAETGRADPRELIGTLAPGTRIYACGPGGLLDALETLAVEWPAGTLRLERFCGVTEAAPATGECRVELRRSGRHFMLAPGESLLEALARAGAEPPSLCREGVCGSCAIPVIEGAVEHRDLLQSDAEKRANDLMYACVSRPLGDTLILDL